LSGNISLIFWHLMSGISIMQCDAQAKHQADSCGSHLNSGLLHITLGI